MTPAAPRLFVSVGQDCDVSIIRVKPDSAPTKAPVGLGTSSESHTRAANDNSTKPQHEVTVPQPGVDPSQIDRMLAELNQALDEASSQPKSRPRRSQTQIRIFLSLSK